MERLVPFADLSDELEFFRGTRFRVFNVGLNVEDNAQDYYDYMLAAVPGESEYMLVTNVTIDAGRNKAGASLCMVQTLKGGGRLVVTGASLKASVGMSDTYLLSYEDA
jgi:hypothetical protein